MKNKYYIGIIIILLGCLVGCELPTHTHKYIDGICSCGEVKYVTPHEHVFIDGMCSCGEMQEVTYQVSFYVEDTLYLTKEVEKGSLLENITSPSKEYHKFLGWYLDDNLWDLEEEVNSDLVLVAKWEELEKHPLTFKVNNEVVALVDFYYEEEIVFDLETQLNLEYQVITNISEYPKYMPNNGFEISIDCYDIRDVFTLSDDGFGISGYLGTSKEVIVPSGYYLDNDFITISRIESWCFDGNKEIESVKLPDTINKIGREAFSNCWNLKNVNIPKGLEVIDYKTFSDTAIEEITIPDSVTTIINSAFSGCEELKSIVIPNSVTEMGDSIFINCNSLVSISIPFTGNRLENASNTYFGHIFGDYEYNKGYSSSIPMSLDHITLTNTVDIADYAFEGVKYVNEITLTEGLKTIGEYAFADCDNLRKIVMPSTLEEIKFSAFRSCNELSEMILNEGLKKIHNVIYSGGKLMSIVVPESVEYVGSCAFGDVDIIYCKVKEQPTNWMSDWNLIYGADYIDVVWGYEG